jgi:hypothetical protein
VTAAIALGPLVDGGMGDAETEGELGDGVEAVEVCGDTASFAALLRSIAPAAEV